MDRLKVGDTSSYLTEKDTYLAKVFLVFLKLRVERDGRKIKKEWW